MTYSSKLPIKSSSSQKQLKKKDKDKNNSNPKNSQKIDSHKTPKTDVTDSYNESNQKPLNLLGRLSPHEPLGSTTNPTQKDRKEDSDISARKKLSGRSTKQAASSSRSEENNSPNRVGMEQELASVRLKVAKDDKKTYEKNGIKLAQTEEQTFHDLPVFKLETEGADRGTICIELIYGPLEMKEYNEKALKDAKKKLLDQLKIKQNLNDALRKYNDGLKKEEKRYKLNFGAVAEKYKIDKVSKETKINTQTNAAIPYSKLGQIPQEKETGFEKIFGLNDEKKDKLLYMKAREEAKIIKEQIATTSNDKHLQSVLTHIIFQEAKFIYDRINKKKISSENKHKFHVMLKLSPEDAIVSILSEQENEALGKWLKDEKAKHPLETSIKNTLESLKSGRRFEIKIDEIKQQLVPAIDARSKGAKKLEPVKKDTDKSKVLDEFNKAIVDEENNEMRIGHTHPRPTNRIPVYSHGNEHYMVVEQRSNHMLNEGDISDNFNTKSKLIEDLSRVSTDEKFFINETEGDGNCFFHAVYEAMYNKRSTINDQETIRERVRDKIQNNEEIQKFLFGNPPDQEDIQDFLKSLETGKWAENETVPYTAEALGVIINVYETDGSLRYRGTPSLSKSLETISMTYTGNHYNSHTPTKL